MKKVTRKSRFRVAGSKQRVAGSFRTKRSVGSFRTKRSVGSFRTKRSVGSKRISAGTKRSVGSFRTKWQKEHQSAGIGPLKKNKLGKYGYHFDISKKERTLALNKAVKEYGALSVYRSLNAIAVYNKNTHPEMSKIAKADRDIIRKNYF